MHAAGPGSKALRRGRAAEQGRIYLVTAVTAGRRPLFTDIRLGRKVVQAFRSVEDPDRTITLAYVVMPDHFHWLLQLVAGSLSSIVGQIKGRASHDIRPWIRPPKRIWQPGFHDHALRREEDFVAVARYVVANPLRAGIVRRLGDYPLWDSTWLQP